MKTWDSITETGKLVFPMLANAVLLVNSLEADTIQEVYWGTATAQTSNAFYSGWTK